MAQLNVNNTRDLLQSFDFQRLFLQELGWEKPSDPAPRTWTVAGRDLQGREIASLAGVSVLEITSPDGEIPDSKARLATWREIAKAYHENLLIFVDGQRIQSLWYWVKRGEKGKVHPRDHYFYKDQPGDLFLSKLASLVIDVADLDEAARPNVLDIAQRLRHALDVERVTKRFYKRFQEERDQFFDQIEGINDERQREWYTSVLLNRLMFVYFLQRKGFLDKGEVHYLQKKLAECQGRGPDRFYEFLKTLFFEGFGKPDEERSPDVRRLIGDIRYLDGGLFLPHKVEIDNPAIRIPDAAFDSILSLFASYSWNLNDTPGGSDDEINPDVLGYIFEKYINQKAFGAYYTRPEITRYLCEQTIHPLILSRVHESSGFSDRQFESFQDLLLGLDARLCRKLLDEVLPSLSILDPACGSGAFLVAALKVLIDVYSVVIGKSKFTSNRYLQDKIRDAERKHPSLYYWIKKLIITDNLFGVDIMEEATEITKLRLFLALVASASRVEDLEPLPNIDFNILAGNSLIGLLHVQAEDFEGRQRQGNLFRRTFKQVLADKNRLVHQYRHASSYAEKLQAIRDEIHREKQEANATLNWMLLSEFTNQGIKFEEATWDARAGREGKPRKRPVSFKDVEDLHPFHWGYEFDQALETGGFDVILTNPPWEALRPEAKEFFSEYSILVTKNKMTIKEFEGERARLLRRTDIRRAWLDYLSRFPHRSKFFRRASEYANQVSTVAGRAKSDVNLYKLFLERCFRLLRDGGRCGILLPTSFYSDPSSKGVRKLIFENASVISIFGLSNERFIFEGVDHRFGLCLLVFERGGATEKFRAAFRIDPGEAVYPERLESFLNDPGEHLELSWSLVTRLSPDSLSIMRFKSERDIRITDKLTAFPRLEEKLPGKWSLWIGREFDMTNDSDIFRTTYMPGSLPLYEGKMIHQFRHGLREPKYWIEESEGRKRLLGRTEDVGQKLPYQGYRLGFRDIARSSDERTAIMTMLPRNVFCNHKLPIALAQADESTFDVESALFFCALMNSFTVDYLIRQRVSANVTYTVVYQTPAPRLRRGELSFNSIVERAAALICTESAFSDLWEEVMSIPWSPSVGASDPCERAKLRAELDGLIAHLYGLTEEEFTYILSTFPVVPQAVKDAALEAYRQFAPKPGDPEIIALISQGESGGVEFKSTVRWDLREQKKNPELEKVIQKTVAGFLNSEGGTLLIGVADDGAAVGLEHDYRALGQKGNRDGFELFLTDLLLNAYGKDVAPCIRTTFHAYDGKEVCRIVVTPSPKAVYIKEGNDEVLYIRTGNSTRRLSTREAVEYARTRWR